MNFSSCNVNILETGLWISPGLCIITAILSLTYVNIQIAGGKAKAPDHGDYEGNNVEKKGKIWAVLVAGTSGWSYYRYQANICHAYQIFRSHHIPDERIIVMMYDDIAYNTNNPYQGKIINKPGGPNVYVNVPRDYTGDDVTAENFLRIITGNKAALKGIGSGKVLESGSNDLVFINFAGLGSDGLVQIIDDELQANRLISAFKTMHENKMYKQMLVYFEAGCSGSMFDGLLPSNISILAISSNLPGQMTEYLPYWDESMQVYLGNYFSVSWMEDIDSEQHHQNLTTETLLQQYSNVVSRCSAYTSPTMYGNLSIANERIKRFFGKDKIKPDQNLEADEPAEHFKGKGGIEDLLDRIIGRLPIVDPSTISESRRPLTKGLLSCYKTVVDAFNRQCVNTEKDPSSSRHLYKFVNMCSREDLSTDQVLAVIDKECSVFTQ